MIVVCQKLAGFDSRIISFQCDIFLHTFRRTSSLSLKLSKVTRTGRVPRTSGPEIYSWSTKLFDSLRTTWVHTTGFWYRQFSLDTHMSFYKIRDLQSQPAKEKKSPTKYFISSYPSGVSGWSARIPWKMRLFFLFCSNSYIFSCISSRMWFIVSSLSFSLEVSVSTSRNLDLYSLLCKHFISYFQRFFYQWGWCRQGDRIHRLLCSDKTFFDTLFFPKPNQDC